MLVRSFSNRNKAVLNLIDQRAISSLHSMQRLDVTLATVSSCSLSEQEGCNIKAGFLKRAEQK